ncbi:MAG: toprim domain-containing protein [Pirellulaceae bacterium]
MLGNTIVETVKQVTKRWTKQRKVEERDAQASLRRVYAFRRRYKLTLKDAARRVMEAAYMKASNNNTLPALARQIMYTARGPIQDLTGEPLDARYFTQTLLPDYMREYAKETANWDVVYDARGHFHEPHTGIIVPLGTLDVRGYSAGVEKGQDASEDVDITSGGLFPTFGPENRFHGVLFIEKEGFLPLFERVKLAERYDIAIMSTKGLSVTASRLLVDQLCGDHGIPLFVLHDFDKAGFFIVGTLSRDTRRYTFRNDINVIDLGLRLEDIQDYALEWEDFKIGNEPIQNLRDNGATWDEIGFLGEGKRVELNAFPSAMLVEWIESKLEQHGIKKLVPPTSVIEVTYRREIANIAIRRQLPELVAAQQEAESAVLPDDLRQQVNDFLDANRSCPWDVAVGSIAEQGA